MMTFWKSPYLGYEGWTTWQHSLTQTASLLEAGGHLCKILFRNLSGEEVGTAETPIPISTYDTSAGGAPKKIIWKSGDDIAFYPNPNSVRVFVNAVELHRTYNNQTIQYDSEFYVQIDNNLIDVQDNVSINFNRTFTPTGKTVTYLYTTRSKSIDQYNLQPKIDTVTFRSAFGFTQYLNPNATFRGVSTPNTLLVSFPPPPAFDTRFYNYGATEEWINRAWTLGTPQLHEFDIIYRVSDGRFYEIRSWEPNIIKYQNSWKMLTQSFELTQLGPNDILRQFTLV